jgi:hypothetical protein
MAPFGRNAIMSPAIGADGVGGASRFPLVPALGVL